MPRFIPQQKVKIVWSSNFAYAIGLITSDGYLNSDRRHIGFKVADKELALKFKDSLSLKNQLTIVTEIGKKTCYQITFGDTIFYKFLEGIGLIAQKSKTIKAVLIPDDFFADFLRGLFDGDGTFWTSWDKRWPNSFFYITAFASASPTFIYWLKHKLAQLYGVKGFIHKGAGVLNLRYVKGDSQKLFAIMYYKEGLLFLDRKYYKIKSALEQDEVLSIRRGLKDIKMPR